MGKLKVLPAQLSNMIAAGEVVQRPSSVVKELVENAVDASATQVSVIIEDAGRTLIQVIDNGVGMSPADAVLCFERHATSKIATPEDLSDIITYGFRGEALASIAAVAEVTLKTRRAQDDTAVQVKIGGGGQTKTASVAAPVGSNFAVRNLFFNTPARRKFLKSDNIEFRHIVEEFTRVAITRPDVSFSLTHNGREVYVLNKAKSLKFRIMDLLGSSVVSDVVDLDTKTAEVEVRGFLGRPDTARKTQGNQFFFVNGRFFRSAYFHKAVMKAYEGLIPDGVTPAYFIFLETDPHTIDVNVHPTKTEVKFEDDSVIFQLLYACVRETLGKNSFGASIDFDSDGAVELPKLSSHFGEYLGNSAPEIGADPTFDPFSIHSDGQSFSDVADLGGGGSIDSVHDAGSGFTRHNYVDESQDYGKLFEQRIAPSSRTLTVQGKYI
ncbi:MAG TPA: DNA mismatch repair endonuclease MutL, partial [Rikenellaceae bacterium]|nr:DNA mismatch repair endonuclease MutL [Rikenellaceae bacterium]